MSVASRRAAAAFETGEKVAEGHLIVEGGLFLEGEEPGFFNDANKESAPGAFKCLDEPLEFNFGGPEAFPFSYALRVTSMHSNVLSLCLALW